MNFEKLFLIFTGSVCTVFLTVSLQAKEKLQTVDAIWNSVGVVTSATSPVVKAKTVKQVTKVATQKKVTPSKTKFTRKQYQARYEHEQKLLKRRQKTAALNKQKAERQKKIQKLAQLKAQQKRQQKTQKKAPQQLTKLDRQRAAWKAKWEATQKAKKHVQVRSTAQNTQRKVATPLKKVVVKQVVRAPQQLTKAQYQWRWKQAQLKNQQQNRNNTKILQPNTKPSYATFRKAHQKADFRRLPTDIVSKFRASGTREYGVSAYAQDVNSPRPLLAYQETTSRVPASVMKLITGYAALGTLGANYRWPLDVFTKGRVHNGTLKGDLIIKGYGSPEFKSADLRKVLQGIKKKGIRNIEGRIVFDSSYFNIPNQYSFDGKNQSKYNAQPDALLFNERINTFQVRAVGKKVRVTTSTPTHNLKIVNRMRKTKRSCRPRIRVSKKGYQTIVTFTGNFSRRCGTRSYSRVISRPAEMIYGSMRSMWKRDVGGTLKTRFAMGRAPANARPLLRTYSRTLAEILPTIIKDSNNVMARQLLLTIGAKKGGYGTPRAGANAIGQWLKSRGLNFPELRIENGSGLSRTARISAAHVGDLLVDAYRSPFRHVFMKSLAVAGVDGTMRGRLKRTQVRGRGFFKTGTLRDVRSIAGYVKAANGKTYVMAILHNDPRAKRRALRAHDKLIEWVYAGGRSKRRVAMR